MFLVISASDCAAQSTFLNVLQMGFSFLLKHKRSGSLFLIEICYPNDGKSTGTNSVARTIVGVLDGSENTLFHHL